ncbi:N-acetylmuramoyl-L-alanine amidase [Lysobacter sp. GX 14042]|uniref:N-acetylmuramoyl-L-alanine amidase n=1 Tax=Lysobacter sp. GX 14042 TaxID=2907155 RepID=UPI001F1E5F79|nr:N-acetylmuramoyl-L-alanine amidase [Lysobacter sp. GX 14042]MCE7032512.1 N-acetylmuramoyl-L-alanine amidase [Lysobacter sp. GX 14042]
MPPEPPPPVPTLPVHDHLLPYAGRLEPRDPARIDLVVIHCTELPDLATAREYGERIVHPASGTGNSGHFYIDRDGSVHRYVPLDRVAHHVRDWNARSLGIELVNTGRYPDWWDSRRQEMNEPYPAAQTGALVGLLARLARECPGLRWITGHEDLDTGLVDATDAPGASVRRKRDPGPMFPWDEVLARIPLRRLAPGPGAPRPL